MSNNVLPDPLNTNPVPKDFLIEVAKGNVAGHATRGIVMRSTSIDNTGFKDIWGGSSNIVYPTANETWEIVSSSANDTSSSGTGARQVLINYLDEDYVEQSVAVDLNGTTPVQVATDCFRPNGALVINSGSSLHNEGDITIQVSGGGSPRQYIMAEFSASEDSHYTVPAGKTAYVLKDAPYWQKNDDGRVRGVVSPFGTNTEILGGDFPAYQNTYDIVFFAPFTLQEKTGLNFRAISSNPGQVAVSFVLEMLIVDNVIP